MKMDFSNQTSKLVVHIGLGKTGTSTLQKHFFPKMCNKYGIIYNPPEFIKIKRQISLYTEDEKKSLQKAIDKQNVLISNEGLVDWNPTNWEIAADRVLDLFGDQANIVITVRETIGYLTSVYTQQVQAGNVIEPHDFFVSNDVYDYLSPFLSERFLLRYNKDIFDLQRLVSLYNERFKNVFVLPLSRYNSLYPWVDIFEISKSERESLYFLIKIAPRENISYSKRAMRWTLLRERALNLRGLRSRGSSDLPKDIFNPKSKIQSFASLNLSSKIKEFPKRLIVRILRKARWRWFMTKVVDKILPHEKYRLPASTSFNDALISSNNRFIQEIEKHIDEIRGSEFPD
jgi:hypothetical protein